MENIKNSTDTQSEYKETNFSESKSTEAFNGKTETENTPLAEFMVKDVFSILGRGVVLSGEILHGEISVGDEFTIGNKKGIVTAIEKSRKLINKATESDGDIGVLVKNIQKNDVWAGITITKQVF